MTSRSPGRRWRISRAAASPTMPVPMMARSYGPFIGSKLTSFAPTQAGSTTGSVSTTAVRQVEVIDGARFWSVAAELGAGEGLGEHLRVLLGGELRLHALALGKVIELALDLQVTVEAA